MNEPRDGIIRVRDLRKVYGSGDTALTVLDGLDLDVPEGSVTAVVGRSGSGKSTLLNLIGGLDRATSGNVSIGGVDIGRLSEDDLSALRNKRVGFIFQFHHLLAEFTVLENVIMPYLIDTFDPRKAARKADELLNRLGIGDKTNQTPNKLSGGESQRVAIARALINEPEIVLADEPTGNLDIANSEIIKELLFGVVRDNARAVVIVTHNDSIVEDADVVYELSKGTLNPLDRTGRGGPATTPAPPRA